MTTTARWIVALIGSPLLCGCAAVRPGPAFSDAERESTLREILETRSYSLGRPSRITVVPGSDSVLFLQASGSDRVLDLYEFNAAGGGLRKLAAASDLLGGGGEELSPEEKARRERQRNTMLGITSFQLSQDGRRVLIPLSGGLHVLDRQTGGSRKVEGVQDAIDPQFSPDGSRIAFVREFNLYVCDWQSGQVRQLTTGGREDLSFGEAEFVAQEEMDRPHGYWWSPDSTAIAYQETDTSGMERLFIADAATPYKPPQSWAYPRAGCGNARVRLAVARLDGGQPVWVNWDRDKYPYLASVNWSENAPLSVLVQARDQREQTLLAVDPATGAASALIRETDPAWLNIVPDMPRWLSDGRSFLWMTESDGEWRLVLHDAAGRSMRVLNPNNDFRLRRVLLLDEPSGRVVVTGSDDATQGHVYELPLSGGAARRLTASPGICSRVYGRGSSTYVEKFDSLSEAGEWRVCRADGATAGALPSRARKPPWTPRVELTRVGAAGEFDAAIVRPRNFMPGARYPVIVSVYGGPGHDVVHAAMGHYFLSQWYADQGFIVVSADNRGVPDRGRAWERAIRGDFGEIPLDDQATALQALGRKYPELDLRRVGIMGWSFGGYMSALAVTKRGDVFHAAAAGAPVIDWRDYDTHYTERYLGLPQDNPDGYARSCVLTYAEKLERPLLLIHGTADDNVYFGNSLKLTDALTRAGRPFEFVPLVGYTHLVPDAAMRIRVENRIAEFFRRVLNAETTDLKR